MATFKPLNRYTNGIVTFTRAGEQFLVLRRPLNLEESNGDVFVTITQDLIRRPDMISHKAYGTPDLWWAIMEYNGIRDPMFDLTMNQILRIPQVDRVLAAISTLNRV